MSGQTALKLALLAQLRLPVDSGGLGIPISDSDVLLDGRPHPRWANAVKGRQFYSVHGTGRRKVGADAHLEVEHTVFLTISMMISAPFDRIASAQIVKEIDGLDQKIDFAVATLHNAQWTIINAANESIGLTVYNGFCEALYPESWEDPQPVDEQWFNASIRGSSQGMPLGLKSTIVFGGARRVQLIGSSGA